jgi:ankyrin repeat protein
MMKRVFESNKSRKTQSEKTLELGKLMASRSRYIGKERWLPWEGDIGYSQYTPEFVKKIAKLLEEGADPHLAVCAYLINGRLYHRLLGSIATGDFFESSYNEVCPFEVRIKQRPLDSYMTHILSPLFDAAENRDSQAISFYSELGVGISSTTSRLASKDIVGLPGGYLRNPFVPALACRQFDIVEQLLDLTKPSDATVKAWMLEVLLTLLWPALGETPNLELVRKCRIHRWFDRVPILSHKDKESIIRCANSHVEPSHDDSMVMTVPFLDGMDIFTFIGGTQSANWSRGPYGITALMVAVGCASTAMCRILLNCGADPNENDRLGMTALADAIYLGHGEAVNILLTHNANPNHVVTRPELPARNRTVIISMSERWLEQRNEAARMYEAKGWSVLHIAAHLGRMRAIKALCNAHADTMSIDRDGCSPSDIAIKSSHGIAASYIQEYQHIPSGGPSVTLPVSTSATDHREEGISPDLAASIERVPSVEKLQTGFEEQLKARTRLVPKQKSPRHDSKAAAFLQKRLCVECSLALETGAFGYISDPGRYGSGCNFCQLLLDCQFADANGLMSLEYKESASGKDNELTMTSDRGVAFHHPLLKMTGKSILIIHCENSLSFSIDTWFQMIGITSWCN